MKKKTFLTTVAIILISNSLFSQKSLIVETNTYFNLKTSEFVPQVNSAFRSVVKNKFSISGFFIAHKYFGKGFIGVGYSPDSTAIFDLKIGMQTPGTNIELKPTFIFNKKRISIFTTLEIGRNNVWYLGNILFNTSHLKSKNKFEVGFEARRNNGIGPIFYFSHNIFSYWTGILYDCEKEKSERFGIMAGTKIKL